MTFAPREEPNPLRPDEEDVAVFFFLEDWDLAMASFEEDGAEEVVERLGCLAVVGGGGRVGQRCGDGFGAWKDCA